MREMGSTGKDKNQWIRQSSWRPGFWAKVETWPHYSLKWSQEVMLFASQFSQWWKEENDAINLWNLWPDYLKIKSLGSSHSVLFHCFISFIFITHWSIIVIHVLSHFLPSSTKEKLCEFKKSVIFTSDFQQWGWCPAMLDIQCCYHG